MNQRRIVIGAIGGDRHKDAAIAFGKAVAERGCILLTGGEPRESDEVKDAAMVGATSAEEDTGAVARLIGILPSDKERWVATNRGLFLDTSLRHNIRNVINGLTPDALVIFGGGGGTLAEAAFAVAANKPMFFGDLPASRDRLIKNFKKYFVDSEKDIDLYLRAPLAADVFGGAWNRPLTIDDLKNGLDDFLKRSPTTAVAPTELVKACVAAAKDAALRPTGFPGLPDAPETKPQFEAIIKRVSS